MSLLKFKILYQSETTKRIIWGLVMLGVGLVSLVLGQLTSYFLCVATLLLVIWEIQQHFFSPFPGRLLLVAQSTFYLLAAYLLFNASNSALIPLISWAMVLNGILLLAIVITPFKSNHLRYFMQQFSVLALVPLAAILYTACFKILIYSSEHWRQYFLELIIINFGSDTFCWFVGKNFGKTPMAPTISPKKTWEGLIGGVFLSAVFISGWWAYWGRGDRIFSAQHFFLAIILSLLAQLGDLVESKFKRLSNIKDSSTLIPGHGGLYDRLDSLVLMAPFYVFFLLKGWI